MVQFSHPHMTTGKTVALTIRTLVGKVISLHFKTLSRFDIAILPRSELQWSESCLVVSDSLQPHGLYHPWNSPGQNIGVSKISLLQRIFPTQGSNTGLLSCRRILYQLSHKGSPRILEWVAYSFSSGSSWTKNGTDVSWIAGRFFTNWAIREASSKE